MDIFNIFSLLGGLALFLYGMNVMGDALERQAGSKLKTILERLTDNPYKGFVVGLAVTAVIQSSSATTVMVVGFVNSGIMELGHAIGIIMGANVGTTVTAWILSLSGIEGDSLVIRLLKPESFSPIIAFIGMIPVMFVKNDKKKNIGRILIGFAVLMYGMKAMSSSVAPLADVPEFTSILTMFSNPLMGVLAGAVLTGVIQSSSASVGILQALSMTGSITYGSATPIIMGQNIGTCVTALLSSIGTNKNAKRTAMVHLYFNIIGTVVFLVLFYIINWVIDFSFISDAATPFGIAIVHTAFNLVCTAVMLPFAKGLEKLAYLTIPDDGKVEKFLLLDERLLVTPSVAIEQCKKLTIDMAIIAKESLEKAIDLLSKFDEKKAAEVAETEDITDNYEDKLGTYLVKVSERSLSLSDSRQISKLLHTIGEFERIGDHAYNIYELAKEVNDKKIVFSPKAQEELAVIIAALKEILQLAVDAFVNDDIGTASLVEPLEEVIDYLRGTLKNRHISRLQAGKCTIEMGFIFIDLLTNFERVADHCSNIAVCVIEIDNDSFDTHQYLNEIKTTSGEFKTKYKQYMKKYTVE